jgi:phosphoribosylanthranilate isomerase
VVRVQIAGVSTLDEALAAEQAGADALGFTVRLPQGIHDDLTEVKARGIVAVLPPFIATVAITYVEEAREAADLCRYLGVGVVQLHGAFSVEQLHKLRALAPHLKIIKAVHVTGPEAIENARPYERRVDAIILDTYDPETGRHGATGKTHDWLLSREIVEKVRTPIILAGGLTPENVGDAIHTVRPWGVDVHTGVEDADGTRNIAKIRAFIERAKAAGKVLTS